MHQERFGPGAATSLHSVNDTEAQVFEQAAPALGAVVTDSAKAQAGELVEFESKTRTMDGCW